MAMATIKGQALPTFNPVAKAKIAEAVEGKKETITFTLNGSSCVFLGMRTAQEAFEKLRKAWVLAKPEKTITVGVSLVITHRYTKDYDTVALHRIGSYIRDRFVGDFFIKDLFICNEKAKSEEIEFSFSCYFDPEQHQFRRGDYI